MLEEPDRLSHKYIESQNIGRLLTSLARQSGTDKHKMKIEVVFIVNNTKDVDQAVLAENKATVAYLESLRNGIDPEVADGKIFLNEAAKTVLHSDIGIHILDYTSPGFDHRNIGRLRNTANTYFTNHLRSKGLLEKGLIQQMDADTTVPENYLESLSIAFSDPALDYALLGLTFANEVSSDPRMFRLQPVDTAQIAMWEFEAVHKSSLHLSGTPRIVARAAAMEMIGGIPEHLQGEDGATVRKLAEVFPRSGAFLPEVIMSTAFRARTDGFDARYYLDQIDRPVVPSRFVAHGLHTVEHVELWLAQNYPSAEATRQNTFETLLAEHMESVEKRKETLLHAADFLVANGRLPAFTTDQDPIFHSDWFEADLKTKIAQHPEGLLEAYSKDFPSLFQALPVDKNVVIKIRTQAVTAGIRSLNPSKPKVTSVKSCRASADTPTAL